MEESLSFLDQCTVMCLGYISTMGSKDMDANTSIDDESYRSLCFVVDQELQEFKKKGDLSDVLRTATYLGKQYKETEASLKKIKRCLAMLDSTPNEETFEKCANNFVELPIESWSKVTKILHLIYKSCAYLGNDKMGSVIDVGVRYMRKTTLDFVTEQGGWARTPESKQLEMGDDISSSIVVLSHEGLAQAETENMNMKQAQLQGVGDPASTDVTGTSKEDAEGDSALRSPVIPAPLSPLNTPPYSFPSSVTTDDERDSLATPPELVERPLMTDSYLQAMGEETRRISSTSGNGFEMINSDNGGSDSGAQVQRIDDVRAFDPPTHVEDIPSVSTPLFDETKRKPSTAQDEDASVFGGYLPHISIGVAIAATAAGLFVLKKNM